MILNNTASGTLGWLYGNANCLQWRAWQSLAELLAENFHAHAIAVSLKFCCPFQCYCSVSVLCALKLNNIVSDQSSPFWSPVHGIFLPVRVDLLDKTVMPLVRTLSRPEISIQFYGLVSAEKRQQQISLFCLSVERNSVILPSVPVWRLISSLKGILFS